MYTIKMTERDAGTKHVGDGKFRHPRRSSGPIYDEDGFSDRSIHI
jgi:hypothetical protein